jgi:hypothetical protein
VSNLFLDFERRIQQLLDAASVRDDRDMVTKKSRRGHGHGPVLVAPVAVAAVITMVVTAAVDWSTPLHHHQNHHHYHQPLDDCCSPNGLTVALAGARAVALPRRRCPVRLQSLFGGGAPAAVTMVTFYCRRLPFFIFHVI